MLEHACSPVRNLGPAPVLPHGNAPAYGESLFRGSIVAGGVVPSIKLAPWSPRQHDDRVSRVGGATVRGQATGGNPMDMPEYKSKLARVHRVASANLELAAARQAREDAWHRHQLDATVNFQAHTSRSFSARRTREQAQERDLAKGLAATMSPRASPRSRGTPRERVVELQQKVDDAKGRLDVTLRRLKATETMIEARHGHVNWPGAGLR